MSRSALVVDDGEDILAVARLSLERIGDWRVSAVRSGRRAVELAHERGEPFEVVLLDVTMPDLDGPATLELLRRAPRTAAAPAVFLTADRRFSHRSSLDAAGAAASAGPAGVAGVILKPFDPMTLPDRLDRLLEGARRPARSMRS